MKGESTSSFIDVFHLERKEPQKMKVRSIVGLIPLFCGRTYSGRTFEQTFAEFKKRIDISFPSEKAKNYAA